MRFLILLSLVLALAADDRQNWPLRWRTCCDPALGVAFRYPYPYFAPDQTRTVLLRMPTGTRYTIPKIPDMRLVGAAATPADTDLAAAGDRLAGAKLNWTDANWYASKAPHRAATWAPAGLLAKLGTGEGRTALVVRHGERIRALVLAGSPTTGDNAEILDSFEVLTVAAKSADKPTTAKPLRTWRDHQFVAGKALDPDGKPATAPAGSWKQALEVETQHYHLTGHVAPARMIFHGQYLEALYRAYSKVFQPESMPPYKFEVHVFATYADFKAASGAWGNGIPSGGTGIVGGFFVPHLLSLWVYEESGALGGPQFSVEHVIAHECSHQFLHLALNGTDHVPTWINEGLAVHFESGVFLNGEFQIRPPIARLDRLRDDYQRLNHPLSGSLGNYLDHHGFIDAGMYGEVYAMIHAFVFGAKAKDTTGKSGLDRFQDYMRALRQREDGAKAFDRIFMADLVKRYGDRDKAIEAWDQQLVQYVKGNRTW